jgi:hypothetical protein
MILVQRWLFHALALVLLSFSAFADGKIFARAAAVPVAIPDQRAMLYFSNGVERLVIETSFIGQGTNFAWVVPLPSAPKIEAVSTNFFAYLNMAFQPKLILAASDWWILFLAIGYLATISIWTYRKTGPSRFVSWFGFLLLLLLLVVVALPNFVRSRGVSSVASADSVEVLNRQSVGIYDTTTLTSADGRALLDWLNSYGFHTPATALPVISDYSKQGWVFVAATINRDVPGVDSSRPHPLAFTFRSDNPVYPLRLTGVDNTHCSIELFVFGPQRAQAAGFRADYCGEPSSISEIAVEDFVARKELFIPPAAGEFQIGNPELLHLALPAPVATKLVAALTAKEMQSDAFIRWIPFEQTFPTLYTREAAAGAAFNWIVGVAVFGSIPLQLLSPQLNRTMRRRGFGVVILLATVCGFVCFSVTKTTEVVFTHGGWFVAANRLRMLEAAVQQYALERKHSGVLTDDELLPALNEYIKGGAKNTFLDNPLRCESTPGNITMRASAGAVEVFWHDINNAPRPLATFPITSK